MFLHYTFALPQPFSEKFHEFWHVPTLAGIFLRYLVYLLHYQWLLIVGQLNDNHSNTNTLYKCMYKIKLFIFFGACAWPQVANDVTNSCKNNKNQDDSIIDLSLLV